MTREGRLALGNLGAGVLVLVAVALAGLVTPLRMAILVLGLIALGCAALMLQALAAGQLAELVDVRLQRGRLFLATAATLALAVAGVVSQAWLAPRLWWICVCGLVLLVLGAYAWFLSRLE